ncbi:MAG: NAD(P)/FAD-dependent oxidoreductase [Acidobacteriota bacterium]|nr:NAD(P)/FAD-dependent oxidoreductase [Acidobacteriota bacterium]
MVLKSEISNSEVLIVGAGPAGSFAAEILARSGATVTLFDGRAPDAPKPCGGGVTSKALKMYPQLLEAVGRQIDDLEIYAPSGKRLYLKLEEPFAIYSRSAFDSFLRQRAEKAGAKVVKEKVALAGCENGLWKLRSHATSGHANEYRGAFLVAADGANSAIAKRLSGALEKSEMEVAFGYRAPLPNNEKDAPTVVAFLPGFSGYAWAFPRPDHVSFGIATAQDNFDHAQLDKLLWSFMLGWYRQRAEPHAAIWQNSNDDDNSKFLAQLNSVAERYAARIPGLAPETLDRRKTAGENWALLGDAAGFADPVTGEGIYYALRSAEIFADCFLNKKDYEQAWRADFGRELRRASEMRRRFYGNFFGATFTERMIQFASLHGGVRKTLRQLVAGDQGYTDLKQKLARRAFLPF